MVSEAMENAVLEDASEILLSVLRRQNDRITRLEEWTKLLMEEVGILLKNTENED
jgi:hypothetical protein